MWITSIIKSMVDSVFSYIFNTANTTQNRTNTQLVDSDPIPLEAGMRQTSSTEHIADALAQPSTSSPWYYIDSKEASYLISEAVRDFTWVILSTKECNYRFARTNNFWAQNGGQQLWSSIPVLGIMPLNAAFCSFAYKESYRNCLLNAAIGSVTVLSAIIPWNCFSYLGSLFFKNINYPTYLSVLFPGPGTAEGIVTAITNAFLSHLLDPNFKFNPTTFGLNLSPVNYISGDAWLALYNAMAGVAQRSTGGLIGQAAVVMVSVVFLEYLTMKAINAISKKCKKSFACCNKEYDGFNLFRLPRKEEATTNTNTIANRRTVLNGV